MTLLAALKAIPDELYEAAAIDGATGLGQFRHVTLPLLASTIVVTILLRTIWIANFADLIFVMTGGGPANATQTVATYIFTTAYSRLDFGYASAIATVLLVLLILYAFILVRLRRDLIGGERRPCVIGKARCRSSCGRGGRYLAVIGYVLFAIFPLFWLVKISVTPDRLLYSEGIRLWPSRATLANFEFVLTQSDFPLYFMNSIIVSLATAVFATLLAAAAGYAFSRFRFTRQDPGRLLHAADADVPARHADRAHLPDCWHRSG